MSSAEQAEPTREEQITEAKQLYSRGSRNYLVKEYAEAADELSQVCALYGDLYGELSDEVGMPYLLYAKSLIALGTEENKVLDVPDEEDDDDDEEGDDEEEEHAKINGDEKKLAAINENEESKEADSTEDQEKPEEKRAEVSAVADKEAEVSSTEDAAAAASSSAGTGTTNGTSSNGVDNAQPGTSNGHAAAEGGADENAEEEDENATNLQLAWEILELAAKIFSRQGLEGLPNLAEVQTELANIEFENNILEAAREDYGKALQIYKELPKNYRRAMAEIHYKIGLTYLMDQLNKEGADSLKEACELIDAEIAEMKAKTDLNDKDKNNIQDMEETKQEIWDKITEIEETKKQNVQSVRAALDNFMAPAKPTSDDGAGPSSSSSGGSSLASSSTSSAAAATSSSKPTDISHLIKRKKPDTPPSSEAEAASPAKRPAA